jgi:hypothetical protein
MSARLIVTVIRHLPALSAKDCRSSLIIQNRLAIGIPKERVVLALANIQADHQIFGGTSNPLLELTKLMDSVTLGRVHGNLLLAQ